MITVRRASGLAVPFDPPELTIDAAIDRTRHLEEESGLLLANEPEYLKITPYPPPLGYAGGIGPAWWIDWPEYDYGHAATPFVTGLPEL